MTATKLAPELPPEFILEIGYFATDWAVIEQNLILHTLDLSEGRPDEVPTGFDKVRKHWRRLALAALPERAKEIERLNDRLARRSEARNYALHGYWRQTGPDAFEAIWLDYRGGQVKRTSLLTNSADITKQTGLLRAMRIDLVNFLNSLRDEDE